MFSFIPFNHRFTCKVSLLSLVQTQELVRDAVRRTCTSKLYLNILYLCAGVVGGGDIRCDPSK